MTTQTLHSNPSTVWNKHQASMMASLAHRLEAARVASNLPLIEQLEQERLQITDTVASERRPWWQALQENLAEALFGGTELKVHEFTNGSDRWWYAIDPRTGRYVYADSDAELRLWIRENYRGR
jgi:hypothetical protein